MRDLLVSAAEIFMSILASAGLWSAHLESLLTESGMVAEKRVSVAIWGFY